jgi:uncharacterized membrane protein (UPF0127 family)
MLRAATLVALALFAAPAAARDARVPLAIGTHVFQVEVAATPTERARGLMGRTRLPANGGMLFVFETADRHCFWMRNTPLPLSIAFIDAAGRIVSLADMAPRTDTLHCPPSEIRHALEVAQGGFAARGIAPGARVEGLPH